MHLLRTSEIDREATASLVNRAFRRHPVMTIDRTSPEYLLEEGGERAEFVQVRDDAGRLVASAMLMPGEASDFEGANLGFDLAEAQYYGLAAAEDGYTGAGIGFEMLREAECLARARGRRANILGTLAQYNLVPYYERHGYRTNHLDHFEAGHWGMEFEHTHHEMVKLLTPTFRAATADDVSRVTEVVNAAYRAEDFFIDGNRTDEIEVADLIAEGSFLVMEQDGDLIGAVYHPHGGGRSYFGMLSMDPKHQNTGLGRVLVDAVERRAIDAGCARE